MIKEINFSKKAVEKINQLIAKKPSGTFFRIAVKGGGCSGFKYDFSFDSKIDVDDLKHQNIVVDKSSLDMLKGSARDGKGYEIACAQLCGNSHYRMRGFVTVESEEEFNAWLAEEAEDLEDEDDGWDDW